jgi:preprotein translocase subunit YajC
MNPGPELGAVAILAAYTVVLGAIVVFMKVMTSRRKRLEKRRQELQEELKGSRTP